MGATSKAPTDFSNTGDGVNRLLGMVVQEVSLVDAAANQRKFLIVKRDETMKTGKGSTTSVRKDESAAGASEPGVQPSQEQEGAKVPAMQAQVKDQLLAALSSAGEKLVTLGNQIKDAPVSDQATDPAVPQELVAQLGEIASMISGIVQQFGGATGDAGAAAAPEKASGLGGITENGGPDEQGAQKRDAEALAKLAGVLAPVTKTADGKDATLTIKAADVAVVKAGLAAVEKAGRKMAKERLARFGKALDLLAGIMKELQTAKVGKSAAPRVVSMPVAQAKELLEAVELLEKSNREKDGELAKVRADLTALQKKTPAPQSLGGGEGNAPESITKSETHWPLDMNSPIQKRKGADFSATGKR